MNIVTRDQRLVQRAYWMISHRWLAILALAAFTWFSKNIFDIDIRENTLYLLVLSLIIINLLSLWLLEFITHNKKLDLYKSVRFVIHFQIIFDLIVITAVLHFTGGISNPFYIIYISHMVISSILLTRTGALIQTTFALLLFGFLIYSEYKGILPHYCLCKVNIINHDLYKDPFYVMKTYGVFALSSYILVYVTASIGYRLRSQEDRLTEALHQIKYNEDLKNRYVLHIAKDVLRDITLIQTNLTLLSDKGKTQKPDKLLEISLEKAQRITNYLKNIAYLNILRQKGEVRRQIISLGDVIVDAISSQYELADEKEITFDLNLDESFDNYYANKKLFELLFRHLIRNAVMNNRVKGQINIRSTDKLRKIVIEISYTGAGIPEDKLPKIFDDHFPTNNQMEPQMKGDGIGLALVKEIVRKHGGKIVAVNRKSGGSQFIIELPKQQ